MRIAELFEYVDEILENPFSTGVKLRWLNQVEAEIQMDVLLLAAEGVTQYTEEDMGAELIVPPPYDNLYAEWLFWRICLAQQEAELANNYAVTYDRSYNAYVRFVCNTINPKDGMAEAVRYYLTAYQLAVKHGFVGTELEWIESLKGPEGEPGTGVELQGVKGSTAELPETAEPGTAYLVGSKENNHLYVYDDGWNDMGPLRGATGPEGKPGVSPMIGENGNWFVWNPENQKFEDTGSFSGGEAPYIGGNGNWWIGSNDSGVSATGPAGYSPVLGKDYWTPEEQKKVSDATNAANTAAGNASTAAGAANTEAQKANTAAENANTAADNAQTKAAAANTATSNANTAAENAGEAAALANQKANAAGTAANAANAAASSANTAAGNANTAASNAQNAADEVRRARETGEFDGVSPTVVVTPISGGHRVSITDENGTKTFDVMNGKNGEGAGDMTSDVYDPQEKKQDVFQYVDNAIGNIPTPDVSGQISTHNTSTGAHNDIRLLITELTTRLNTLANSEDVDLDQMAELVAYIKDNRELIEQVTTNKVSVSDIINNLTTNVSNKPLSAAQGVALKALVDAAATAASNAQSAADNAASKAISSMSYNTSTNQWTIAYTDGTSATVTGPTIPSTNVEFGQGYASCSTAASTAAKTASLTSYALKTGGVVAVKFTYAVPASATLNIDSTGAKYIYHHGTYLKDGVINAGDVATFMYNGSTYTLLTVDRGGSWNDLTGKPASFTPAAHSHEATDVTSGVFDEARIPNLAASKITSGVFDVARIPSLAASKIAAGTFAGQVVANSSGQDAATSLLRNSKLASSETDPTVNGEINWAYE